MTSEKILTRIQRLLALAGNNPSATEAQAALLQARKLMAEHGVTEETLEKKTDVVIEDAWEPGQRDVHRAVILKTIAVAHRCTVALMKHSETRHNAVVYGYPSDVAVVHALFRWAWEQAEYLSRVEIKRRKLAGLGVTTIRTVRGAYLQGFARGLKDAYDEQTRGNPAWALVLAVPKDVLEIMQEQTGGEKTRVRSPKDEGALERGRAAGYRHVNDNAHRERQAFVESKGPLLLK